MTVKPTKFYFSYTFSLLRVCMLLKTGSDSLSNKFLNFGQF